LAALSIEKSSKVTLKLPSGLWNRATVPWALPSTLWKVPLATGAAGDGLCSIIALAPGDGLSSIIALAPGDGLSSIIADSAGEAVALPLPVQAATTRIDARATPPSVAVELRGRDIAVSSIH
jgi:hypothetical protein